MAYQTGVSSGGADLLDKFRVFAESVGFVTDMNMQYPAVVNVMAANNRWIHMHNGAGLHFDLFYSGTAVSIPYGQAHMYGRLSTGFLGTDWNNQPFRSGRVVSDLLGGSFPGYWFFGDATGISCVVEISTGLFRHFGVGSLQKIGAYTGGEWMSATYYQSPSSDLYNGGPFDNWGYHYGSGSPVTVFRCEVDGKRWFAIRRMDVGGIPPGENFDGNHRAQGSIRGESFEAGLTNRTPNTINALSVLFPIRAFIEREESGLLSPVGNAVNMKSVNLRLLSPRDEITFGSDVWKVFPISQKAVWQGNPNPVQGSYDEGIAYKKIV